ncbi:hypothetical protein ETAA8_25960 [Anatilimnocola aggregata]|uniref:Uncharacterized protein n=2 Tax=Anatilimnocola aggregata TaxID=2528021 RepID=A0A517YB85_9BACT|nr:hypothetical protein ETAA8_25960 [Anatilimnocola aggregata]
MPAERTPTALGFLTVTEHAELGLFGGYLVLNHAGRPLEFHCTSPVKANRAQEILYGPTLRPYLFGEQIGQTLIAKARNEVALVCTDLASCLAAREFIEKPLLLIMSGENKTTTAAEGEALFGARFKLGKNDIAIAARFEADEQAARTFHSQLIDGIDLTEPFARIREALEEAQKSVRQVA